MARKRKFTASIPVQLTQEMRDRVTAVADTAEVAMADVIRDCIEAVLPNIEMQLGLVELEEEEHTVLAGPRREDRSAGCFGGPAVPPG